MTVLVCGDRNWTDHVMIREELAAFPRDTLVIHGAARGADRIGAEMAKGLGMTVMAFPAKWDEHGKQAGPIRNQEMLEELLRRRAAGEVVSVHAFHDNLADSKGTLDMVRRAQRAKVDVLVHSHTTGTEKRSAGNEGAIRGRLETLWTTIETCREKERVAMREIRELEGRL